MVRCKTGTPSLLAAYPPQPCAKVNVSTAGESRGAQGNHSQDQEVRWFKANALKQREAGRSDGFCRKFIFNAKKTEIRHSAPPVYRQKKWGVSFLFSTLSLPERVQISFMQIKSTAKLLPAVLLAQNMCS